MSTEGAYFVIAALIGLACFAAAYSDTHPHNRTEHVIAITLALSVGIVGGLVWPLIVATTIASRIETP